MNMQDLRASLGDNQIGGTPIKQVLSASYLAEPERIWDSCVSVSTVQTKFGFIYIIQSSRRISGVWFRVLTERLLETRLCQFHN